MSEPRAEGTSPDDLNLEKVKALLKTKDDTQRFVGLALLKSVLDNSPEVRHDELAVRGLWASISPKFLDRLLKTGSSSKGSREMLDLAVSILHTFSILLPEDARGTGRMTDRIPTLISAILLSSAETLELLLQLLYTLASTRKGAEAIVNIDDLSPLTEAAPGNPVALDILSHAWLNVLAVLEDKTKFAIHVDKNVQNLVSSFKGTDAVTLLEFLGGFLRQANPNALPRNPNWLKTIVNFIQNLVTSRPTPEARSAYTNATASLIQTYPDQVSHLLFGTEEKEEKPFSYLLINLLLIDIRSSAPLLLEQLNQPQYPKTSRRLASAFDTISLFIGFLIRSLEDESFDSLIMPAESLLKLRRGISETMSVTIEYLRDRWDASVAGAMGLHPDVRASTVDTASGSHHALTWDSAKENADADPFILSAIRALSLWLREDENDLLRKEATGLTDMFMDLYQSTAADQLDFRSPVLVALEALVTLEDGREILLKHEGWKILAQDLASIMQRLGERETMTRGIDIVRVLLPVVETEKGGTTDAWMDLITTVAAWDISPDGSQDPVTEEFEVAALQLSYTVLERAPPGTRKRYIHSISAIAGIAGRLHKIIGENHPLKEQMDDVIHALDAVR